VCVFFSQKNFLKGFTSFFVNKENLKNNYKTFLKEFFYFADNLASSFFLSGKIFKKTNLWGTKIRITQRQTIKARLWHL
jgi:hypothetical protein